MPLQVQEGFNKLMAEQASLAQDGKAALGAAKSPADMIKAFQENDDFVRDVKAVICEYVKELVISTQVRVSNRVPVGAECPLVPVAE